MSRTRSLWLQSLARDTARYLGRSRATGIRLYAARQIRSYETETGGWLAEVGRLPGRGRGVLQLWLDMYWKLGDARLCATFRCTNRRRVRQIAAAGSELFGKATPITERGWHSVPDGRGSIAQLKRPLPARLVGKPLLEVYRQPWQFYTVVLPDGPILGRTPPADLVHRVAEFFADVARADAELNVPVDADVENRRVLREHLARERSPKLALAAKVRDGYTCRVCGLNFGVLYGSLGDGYAEAHHTAPLHKRSRPVRTPIQDLVTVCANCHAMLHRLPGRTKSVNALAKHFTARWPRRPRAFRSRKPLRATERQ
jgi:5-methylcytosine-specific restriction endonuclease McrA